MSPAGCGAMQSPLEKGGTVVMKQAAWIGNHGKIAAGLRPLKAVSEGYIRSLCTTQNASAYDFLPSPAFPRNIHPSPLCH